MRETQNQISLTRAPSINRRGPKKQTPLNNLIIGLVCRPKRARRVLVAFASAVLFLSSSPKALSQGCIAARHFSLSLGEEGISYLDRGEWEANISYRYLHSERIFIGGEEQPQLHDVGHRNTLNSIDLTATYAFSPRFNLSLTLPFVHDDYSSVGADGIRHTGSSGGLGDIRLVASAWLLKPATHKDGNVTLGVGMKFPTGDAQQTGKSYNADGTTVEGPLSTEALPGDGGWGVVLQMQAFQRLVQNLYGYASGFYLVNPQSRNGDNSIPDIYSGRFGFSYENWPVRGLSFSLGARIDGVPVQDVIGPADDGFRRAGYAIYIDPGVTWAHGKTSFSINVPVAVERHEERTIADLEASQLTGRHIASAGGFADFIVLVSYSRRF